MKLKSIKYFVFSDFTILVAGFVGGCVAGDQRITWKNCLSANSVAKRSRGRLHCPRTYLSTLTQGHIPVSFVANDFIKSLT